MQKWLNHEFVSSCHTTEEFKAFANDFKKAIKSNLPEGCALSDWNRGHFCVSGFISNGKKYIYFSISDVRHFPDDWYNNILIRTAKNLKDYTGGCNNYTSLKDFKSGITRLLG